MFNGSLVALVTPMQENGDIDYQAFSRLIEWHLASGSDGLVVLGTTGESPTVLLDERKQLIEIAVNQVNDRVPVIVGSGANSTKVTIDLTQQAMELGADAALLVTPYYNKPTQEGLYQHFKQIAESVPIPQILYNVPSRTSCDLLPETWHRLASISNIIGIKDATGDIDRLRAMLAKADEVDYFSGDDATAMAFMQAGGKGVISVIANVVPKLVHELYQAIMSDNQQVAQSVNEQLQQLNAKLMVETNPIPVKWAVAELGLIGHGIRLPLTPLAESYRPAVRNALQLVGAQVAAN